MNKPVLATIALSVLTALIFIFYWKNEDSAPAFVETGRQSSEERQNDGRRGALVDQIVFTQQGDIGQVVNLIESGSHHIFTQAITSTTVFQRLRDSKNADYDISYGSSVELTLNPTGPHFANGELNPFHVPAIREALNQLINRRYIAEEIYGGLAVPRFLPLSTAFPDYAHLADVARALELRYQHDPEAAKHIIDREMQSLGAQFEQGRWWYQDRPVRLRLLIRTEDARKNIGDYIGALLENLGFEISYLYRTAGEASRIWLAGDPHAGHWHLYTGGWVASRIERDLTDNFSYYYTSKGRADPLWQAYRPSAEFDEIADRLQRRDYRTWPERRALMSRALQLALEDSVRVWLVDQINAWPRAHNVRLAVDLAGGVSASALWPYTLRFDDQVGGNMVIGSPGLLTEPWNPVAGSNWIFDQKIIRALQDPPLLPDPFTGLYWPQHIQSADVTVQYGVPLIISHDWLTIHRAETINVPGNAWIDWNSHDMRFITVAEKYPDGLEARGRIRIRYKDDYWQRRWHDGTTLSLADLLLPWILSFERADPNSPLYDSAHVPNFESFQGHFRGWRIVSKQPLIIDIYSDQIHPDAEVTVADKSPSVLPWHTLALGILAEQNERLAFSSHKADHLQIDWLSLVSGPSLPIMQQLLESARLEGFIPFTSLLKHYLSPDEVETRYKALSDWYAERGHFWIGNGPFYLHSVHPLEGSIVLRRNEDFPDPADKWLRFAQPEIPELVMGGPILVKAGQPATFDLQVTFQGKPYPQDAIDEVIFLLFDGDGKLSLKGKAEPSENGIWRVTLTTRQISRLGAGANSLELAVKSNRIALPSFASHGFATLPADESIPEGIEP
ncbi:ABC transporter substrate-binding protein [Methylotuvimicrobium sp.]|uniref:ABC transporter substrate-binding protein n=1 Tax=Methylotuvimicrobium sp. TaxID=2822413 RepID=UPI003D65366F